jgi:hypothetical protein
MTPDEVNQRVQRAFDDPRIIQAALARGVADARRQYAQAGMAMAGWRNGKVIWVDPVTLQEVSRPATLPPRSNSHEN